MTIPATQLTKKIKVNSIKKRSSRLTPQGETLQTLDDNLPIKSKDKTKVFNLKVFNLYDHGKEENATSWWGIRYGVSLVVMGYCWPHCRHLTGTNFTQHTGNVHWHQLHNQSSWHHCDGLLVQVWVFHAHNDIDQIRIMQTIQAAKYDLHGGGGKRVWVRSTGTMMVLQICKADSICGIFERLDWWQLHHFHLGWTEFEKRLQLLLWDQRRWEHIQIVPYSSIDDVVLDTKPPNACTLFNFYQYCECHMYCSHLVLHRSRFTLFQWASHVHWLDWPSNVNGCSVILDKCHLSNVTI